MKINKREFITIVSMVISTVSGISQNGITYDAINNQAKITTSFGNLWLGPSGTSNNYGWCHIKTDASMFYMDKTIVSATGIFGAYGATNLVFQTNANPNPATGYNVTRMTILNSNGNVGIGTNTPYKKLNVNGDVAFLGINGNNTFEILSNGAIPSRRGISLDNDPSGKFNFYIHGWQANASFNFKEGNSNTTLVSINSVGRTDIFGAVSTDKYFVVNDFSNTSNPREAFIVYGNGKTEIHLKEKEVTANALEVHDDLNNKINFRVKQNGYVYAREINVMPTNINFPDYVFSKDYSLMPLSEVENYVNHNKHLPNIPSAEEVAANGINLAEMQVKQMEKIEELFLHLIELKKENEALKNRIVVLEK